MALYVTDCDPELLLAALTVGMDPEQAERVKTQLRAAREHRASPAGRIPMRDLRHYDLHGPMGAGAWDAQQRRAAA